MNMTTKYLGLTLKHPVVSSASPLAQNLDGVRRLEDAGASAIVLPSLFEEQIEQEAMHMLQTMKQGTESFAEATSYLPEPERFLVGPEEYLNLDRTGQEILCHVPIIASLNGKSPGSWAEYAKQMEQAGADALELNVYYLGHELQHHQRGSRRQLHQHSACCQEGSQDSGRDETESVFLGDGQHGQAL